MVNENEKPANSTAILNKLDNGELSVKGKKPKQPKPLQPPQPKEPDKIAQPEGTADQKVEKKAKPKKQKKPTTVQYPADARINAYNFLRLSNDLLADLGWHVDMKLKVDKNADGSITLRKA